MNHLKLFEDFGEDAYFYPGIVLNLKQRTGGGLFITIPIYAVSNYDYEIGNPPLIQNIPKEKRTTKDNEMLKLQGYFDKEFNNLLKITYSNKKGYSKLNGLINHLKELGYDFKTMSHETGRYTDNEIENTLFFETRYEIDNFLKDMKNYVDIVTMPIFTKEDPYGEEDWD